jgi:serine/threonine protein kinase
MLSLAEFEKKNELIGEGQYGKIYKYGEHEVVKWAKCVPNNCRCTPIRTELSIYRSIKSHIKFDGDFDARFISIDLYHSVCPMAYSMKYMPFSLSDVLIKECLVPSDPTEMYYFNLMMSTEEELDKLAEAKELKFAPPSDHRSRLSKVYQLLQLEIKDPNIATKYVQDHPYMYFDEILMDVDQLDELFEQLIQQLIAMQEMKITHRDISPDNILLDKIDGKYRAYIVDFGCALKFNTEGNTVIVGTKKYYPRLDDQYHPWLDCVRILYVFCKLLDYKISKILMQKYYQTDIFTPAIIDKIPLEYLDANKLMIDYLSLKLAES